MARLCAIVIASIALTLSAQAAYILGNLPLSKSDTGAAALGADQIYLESLYTLTNGEPRVVYGLRYWFGSSHYRTQIWDFGLSNTTSRVLTVSTGSPPIYTVIPTFKDSVVIGTQDPGHLWEYWPLTGATNYIKKCSGRDYYRAYRTSDGLVLMGCYGPVEANAGTVESYDPETQTATEWGKIDEDQTDPTYVYQIVGTSDYFYCRVRTLAGAEYLGIIQTSTSAKVLHWKGGSGSLVLAKGDDDENFYIRQVTNSVTKYWQLDGTNTPTLLGGDPGMESTDKHSGRNTNIDLWESLDGWEVEPTFAVVEIAGSVPQCSVRYRKVGETDWTTITETNNWTLGPYNFLQLEPFDSNTLLWTADSYGPIGYMETDNSLQLVGSQAGLSWMDLLVVGPNDVYFAGYHNRSKRWNPTLPWTYSVSASDTDTNVNPHIVTLNTLGKYHYYLDRANDGRIYIGSHHERGTTGGELGWFDPSDYSNGEERTTFLSYDVRDLKSSVGRTKMVYVSSASDGKVFIWDVASDTVDTSFSPLGARQLDKVVEYESGKLFGITGTNTFAFTTAGALLWSNNIPATAWTGMQAWDHRITLGPDGAIWQCAGGDLYRISTADGSYTNLLDTTTDFNVTFLGTDLYLYGGTGGTKIWKVADALEYVQVSGTNSGNAYPRRRGVGRFGF